MLVPYDRVCLESTYQCVPKASYEEGLSSVEPTPNQLSRREHACSNKALAFCFVLAVKVKGINNPKSISFLSVSGLFSILFTTSNISQQRLIANSLWVSCFIMLKLSCMRRQWCHHRLLHAPQCLVFILKLVRITIPFDYYA